MPPFWIVARCLAHNLELALIHLEAGGFESFVPKMLAPRTAKAPPRVTPLFVGYIFVHVLDGLWQPIRRTVGVVGVLTAGDAPSRCPDAEIDKLMARADAQGIIHLPRKPRFALGDRVRVIGGPLNGFDGLYAGMGARERAAVLIQMLGSQRRVEVPAELLAAG
jgi:transcriptional antiterminator RfaH